MEESFAKLIKFPKLFLCRKCSYVKTFDAPNGFPETLNHHEKQSESFAVFQVKASHY